MTFPIPTFNTATLWQIGTGNSTRDYSQVFLDYGIVCIGPGHPGPYSEEDEQAYTNVRGRSKIKAFASEVKIGDWILAKRGLSTVLAIGRVSSGYYYSSKLDDIEGWDLQHYRTIDWITPEGDPVKLNDPLLAQSAFCRVWKRDLINEQLQKKKWKTLASKRRLNDALNQFVPLSGFLDIEKKGLAEQVTNTVRWYLYNDYYTPEYELTCHCVVPFLKLLGWKTQQIKLERRRVDVMLFENELGHLNGEVPKVIIEVKAFGNGLAHVGAQALGYFNKITKDLPEEADKPLLVVTNGMRWNILEPLEEGGQRVKGGFSIGRLRERDSVWAGDQEPIDTPACLSLLKP